VSEQPGRYQRSPAGMVGAMLVLLGIIAAFVLFRSLFRDNQATPVQTVDYQQSVGYVRRQAHFHLVAPTRLPKGWRATSVSFTGGLEQHWHLGVLTDQERYVGLEQGDTTARSLVKQYVDPDATPGRAVSIEGHTWGSWTDSGGDRALVRRAGRTTTLVVGPVDQRILVDYVRSLR
jgi:hypothetical protein